MADWPAGLREELAADVRRVSDRLRSLSQAQLAAPVGGFRSRAEAAWVVAQSLAEAAQALEEREAEAKPWRPLPRLSDFAVGDQLAVVGNDLLAALERAAADDEVWSFGIVMGGGVVAALTGAEEVATATRRTALAVVSDAASQLATLRRLL